MWCRGSFLPGSVRFPHGRENNALTAGPRVASPSSTQPDTPGPSQCHVHLQVLAEGQHWGSHLEGTPRAGTLCGFFLHRQVHLCSGVSQLGCPL